MTVRGLVFIIPVPERAGCIIAVSEDVLALEFDGDERTLAQCLR